MANPNPRTDQLTPLPKKGDKPLKGRLFVRVTEEIESAVKSLPGDQSSEWLRRVITEAAQRELLSQTDSKSHA